MFAPPLTRPEKYEKLAFTSAGWETTGLIAWALGAPLFVLIVASSRSSSI